MDDDKLKKELEEKKRTLKNVGAAGGGSEVGNQYIRGIDSSLETANKANIELIHTKTGDINQSNNLDGFIAEQHHVDTFNLDAAAQGKPYHAEVLKPQAGETYGKNSVDIVIKDNATGKVIKRYQSKYGKDPKATEELFDHGDYRGQQKLVPEGHSSEIDKRSTESIEYDGVKSKPLSKDAAKEAQQKAQKKGKSTKYDWKKDVNTNSALKGIHTKASGAAQAAAVLSGSISFVSNIVAVAKGETEPDEAILSIVKDTGTAAVVAYGATWASAGIQLAMNKTGNAMLRTVSKSNLPAQIVTVALETGKTLLKYAKGEIDGVECIRELGEKGTGMVGSVYLGGVGAATATAAFGKTVQLVFGSLGTVAIPIPVVGTIVGSMVGYVLGTFLYSNILEAMNILKNAKLAREERIHIETECADAVKMIRQYRAEIEIAVSEYLSEHISTFQEAFDGIKIALDVGDIDGFIAGANSITCKLGGKPQFNNLSEFNSLMENDQTLRL